MQLGIVGYGVVGKHLASQFKSVASIAIFDKYDKQYNSTEHREAVNKSNYVFVSVPTPAGISGRCDISAVEDAVSWIIPPICIKSTVPPGTTDRLTLETGKRIVFSPEYVGETPFHESTQSPSPNLLAFGGEKELCRSFLGVYRLAVGPGPRGFITNAATAELAKYMENTFLAMKVAFVAQFALTAEMFGADFEEMREIWVADPRVGISHSAVIGSLGFGGRCLPKDLSAILTHIHDRGAEAPLLQALQNFNDSLRMKSTKIDSSRS